MLTSSTATLSCQSTVIVLADNGSLILVMLDTTWGGVTSCNIKVVVSELLMLALASVATIVTVYVPGMSVKVVDRLPIQYPPIKDNGTSA